MNFAPDLFSLAWHIVAAIVGVGVAAWVVRTAPWQRLKDGHQLNALFGAAVILTLLWSLNAGVYPGLNLHLLGAMATTLIFGPQLPWSCWRLRWRASRSTAAPSGRLTRSTSWRWRLFRSVQCALHPYRRALASQAFLCLYLRQCLHWRRPHRPDPGRVASLGLAAAGAYPVDLLLSDYLPFFLLLGFAEAWLSGMTLTLLVVYCPEWVASFDDRSYLMNK
jgi:hypothetical protein